MSGIANATKNITNLAEQINNTTDCSALTRIFEQHLDSTVDVIKGAIQSQLETAKNFLPIIKPPTSIGAVIGFLKKLVLGSVYPQFKAFLKLLKAIAELQKALQELLEVIETVDDKLKACLNDSIVEGIKGRIQGEINNLTAPIDEALSTINTLETEIKAVINDPTDPYIVTSSIDAFLATVDEGAAKLGVNVEAFSNAPTEETESFTGNVENEGITLVIENGIIIDAQANTA